MVIIKQFVFMLLFTGKQKKDDLIGEHLGRKLQKFPDPDWLT